MDSNVAVAQLTNRAISAAAMVVPPSTTECVSAVVGVWLVVVVVAVAVVVVAVAVVAVAVGW